MSGGVAQMHLDGCHFFAWVFETVDGRTEMTWYERIGDDLYLHADSDCERCEALSAGAKPRENRAAIELPADAKEAFIAVLVRCAELESDAATGKEEA